MLDEQRFVTIADFTELLTAEFYQSLLEENGVQAFVPTANTAATRLPFAARLFGMETRIALKVPAYQVELALDVLRVFDESGLDAPASQQEEGQDHTDQPALDDEAYDAGHDSGKAECEEDALLGSDDGSGDDGLEADYEGGTGETPYDGEAYYEDEEEDAFGGTRLLGKWLLIAILVVLAFMLFEAVFG